jgi:Mg2+ and Co2+ transporter CorA
MSDNSTETLNDSHDQKLDQILAGLQKLDGRIERLEADGPELRTRIELIETKIDERLRETRPIWEGVHAQLTELRQSVLAEGQSRQAQIGELKESQQSLRAEMEKSFRLLDRRMEMYAEMVARVHAYERDLEDRVDELAKRLA